MVACCKNGSTLGIFFLIFFFVHEMLVGELVLQSGPDGKMS